MAHTGKHEFLGQSGYFTDVTRTICSKEREVTSLFVRLVKIPLFFQQFCYSSQSVRQ